VAQEGSKMLMRLIDSGTKGFAEFMDYQLTEDMFKGDEKDLFLFVKKHAIGYAKLPERETVESWATEESTSIPSEIPEPAKYYFDKMEHRNLKLGLLRAMKAAEEERLGNPYGSLSLLTSDIIQLGNKSRRTKLVNFAEDGKKIIHSEFVKAHAEVQQGLKLGWPTFDKMSGGLGGGDVVTIVGRPGMGKTYMALHAMIHAWNQGMTTLFVSMEMKTTPIVQRVAAVATHTSIDELRAGKVATKKYRGMMNVLGSMKGEQGMWLADGALSVTVEDLQMLCSQLQPDLVIVDGAYLMRHPNMRLQRHDRLNSNQEDMKQHIAEALNIPLIQTLQLNREAAKKLKSKGIDGVDLEDIAGSDSVGQISSAVLGLFEEESIETKLKRLVRLMKGRNGEQGEWTINWRFGGFGVKQDIMDHDVSNIMNFTEILPENVSREMRFMGS